MNCFSINSFNTFYSHRHTHRERKNKQRRVFVILQIWYFLWRSYAHTHHVAIFQIRLGICCHGEEKCIKGNSYKQNINQITHNLNAAWSENLSNWSKQNINTKNADLKFNLRPNYFVRCWMMKFKYFANYWMIKFK